MKNNVWIKLFCYENRLTFPIYVSNQKFKNSVDLMLVTDGDKWYYVYIEDFDRFTLKKKQKIKTKNAFVRVSAFVLVVKMCWQDIKKIAWALMVCNLWD